MNTTPLADFELESRFVFPATPTAAARWLPAATVAAGGGARQRDREKSLLILCVVFVKCQKNQTRNRNPVFILRVRTPNRIRILAYKLVGLQGNIPKML